MILHFANKKEMEVHGVLPQLEKFSSDHFGGTIDCVLRLGLPCYQDQNQADGITPQGTHNFSNMNNGGSYSTQAMKENEMQIGKENADVTFYDYANHRPWSPSTTTRVVQSNNENICGYVEVPPIEIPSGFNCFGSPSFHSDSLNLQKPVIPTRGRSKRKYMKKASDSKRCCSTCERKKTPLWRKGPDGPQTLCNACGLRYSRAMKRVEKALGLQFNLNIATQEELGDEALDNLLF